MNKISINIIALLLLVSCNSYQKALKSEDTSVKVQTASELYEAKKYSKALKLYEQVAPSAKGKPSSERMFFMMSKSYYYTNQFYLAGYGFESFVSNYPKSEKREEAAFLGAECFYRISPEYTLDQKDTYKALEKLQKFIDTYPNSEFIPQANKYVSELNNKLELKAFEIAKQYSTIAEWARDFTAPIKALDNFISDYPGTYYKEDAMYYKLESFYKLSMNSVSSKKEERLNAAKASYDALIKFRPNSKYKKEADAMLEDINKELKQYVK